MFDGVVYLMAFTEASAVERCALVNGTNNASSPIFFELSR